MKKVLLQEAAPGMVLAKPITNAAGLIVAGTGLTLDEQLIAHLVRLGKSVVYVEGAPGEGITKSLAELEHELHARFRKVDGDPQLLRIRDAIRRHLRNQNGVSR